MTRLRATATHSLAEVHEGWPPILIVAAAASVIGAWLLLTPPGLLGKADAVGYAVCHRIDGRSFHLGDRQLPLCARCTGLYLGALLGTGVMLAAGRARASGLPPGAVSAALALFVAAMGVDGVNSYLTFFRGVPHLYEPQNWLRLTTGMLAGLAVSALVLPSFSGTLWRTADERPALASFRELALLLGVAGILIGLILTENPIVLYPLALLSSLGVLALLAMIQTTLWLALLRRTNRVETWRGAAGPLLAGLTLAVAQVAAIDALRYAFTGTWSGFAL